MTNIKKTIKAVIFDMDGVISDTQIVHSKVESELLKGYGIDMSPEKITARFAGVGHKEMFKQIFEDFRKELPCPDELAEKVWARVNILVKGNTREVPGTREFIDRLRGKGLPLAVASGSRISFIQLVLSELNLRSKFDVIASSEEVEKGKPEPDVFLLAAKRLSVRPEDCLVVEDGINGMIAAKRAGMMCLGLVKHQIDQNYPTDLLVEDLRDKIIDKIYKFYGK